MCKTQEWTHHVSHLIKYAQYCCLFHADNRWTDYASGSVYILCLITID